MNILEINKLKKSFKNLPVLKEISLKVTEGEVVAIIGPSGSGKSTLLRCATLLETMDSGELSYIGEKVAWNDSANKTIYADKKHLRKAKSNFGLVFQSFNLFPHYSVLKNIIDAPISVQKRDKHMVMEEAYDLLEKVGLKDKAMAYPHELSGGQQQRVSIARALALNPKILFFDEPTSALDPELTAGVLKIIKELAALNMTMVIVTHEIEFAKQVADRIIFMADGLIMEEGDAKELINNPQNPRTQAFLSSLKA